MPQAPPLKDAPALDGPPVAVAMPLAGAPKGLAPDMPPAGAPKGMPPGGMMPGMMGPMGPKAGPGPGMLRGLPAHVEIVASHPLFGPQRAGDGLAGLKIAVCPLRGGSGLRVAAFLRHVLGLTVIVTTPEAHDREAAMVQGLTHLIAKVLVQMEPLPSRMTTRSFDLLVRATEMVRYDAPEVYQAIEHANPYAASVRRRFFELASGLDEALERPAGTASGTVPSDA